jgi:hypothetical protein
MVENKNHDEKMKELKIELLKQNGKRKDIKRQIAKLLTLQKNKPVETKKLPHSSEQKKKISAKGSKK